MKNFRQLVKEMAKPREKDKAKVYYHGTSDKEAADILKTGKLKGRPEQGKMRWHR